MKMMSQTYHSKHLNHPRPYRFAILATLGVLVALYTIPTLIASPRGKFEATEGVVGVLNYYPRSDRQILEKVARNEGVPVDVLWTVYVCETSRGQDLYNEDDPHGGAEGYFQIIRYWHPVTKECAYDLECSATYFANKYKQGQASQWACYKLE